MSLKNHKGIETKVVIIFNHYKGGNLLIDWGD